MRYVYFPKLLKDLENIGQYNDLLPDSICIENIPIEQIMKSEDYVHVRRALHICSHLGEDWDGRYVCRNVVPWRLECCSYSRQHPEDVDHDADFYIYSPAKNNKALHQAACAAFDFVVRIIENAYICTHTYTSTGFSPSRQDKGEATIILLKQLVKDYASEEAFRNDILKGYPFALTEGFFDFTAINNNLDNLKKLDKAIHTCKVTSYYDKFVNVLNEIDFWIDSADYDQLCAYEYLLRDDFAYGDKYLQSVDKESGLLDYLDEVRRHIIKAKHTRFKDQKISLRLDELQLANVKPKDIKLRLQW